jgi:hypothetical protein
MTHDPHRLATVEQIMNGNNPFEKVDTPLGTMERWRAEAMIIGTTSGALHVFESIRADAAAQAARADADEARNALTAHLCDQITELSRRFDDLQARLNEAEDARKADAARKAKLDEEPLVLPPLPPDIAEKQASAPPAKIDNDAGASKEPDPNLEIDPRSVEEDGEGDLPNQLLEGMPPAPNTYPNPELPHPPVVSQPISVSLNEE